MVKVQANKGPNSPSHNDSLHLSIPMMVSPPLSKIGVRDSALKDPYQPPSRLLANIANPDYAIFSFH